MSEHYSGSENDFVSNFLFNKKCVWDKKFEGTQTEILTNIINSKYGTNIQSYWDLHEWSVKHYDKYYEEILILFNIKYSGAYKEVAKVGRSIIDVEWFSGAKMNYAENVLRNRDERIALICLDEEGHEDIITYAEMYEEVTMYSAAFKKLGLKEGDMVACYMSNKKEAIFAMLGAISLGGVWGGALPYYGTKAALQILQQMNPKFLMTTDRFQDSKIEINLLKNIPGIVDGLPCLTKVVLVPTKPETLSFDLMNIKKCCFLKEFLECGRDLNGHFPEMDFIQLPFNHPIFVNFTSGTTGQPKALLHSACSFLPLLRSVIPKEDFTEKVVIFSYSPVGWILWNMRIPDFLLGRTILLYNGNPHALSKTYYWDLLAKYEVTYTIIVTSCVEKMEKSGSIPGPNCNLENLKMFAIGSYPVKPKHIDFIYKCVPNSNLFVYNAYGGTEFMGILDCTCFNLPLYNSEIQAPPLGVDVKCYNKEGTSVVGEYGELVITNPNPSFPIGILNDHNKKKFHELYLSKYKGVWCQHDMCWINPETKGFVVIGRSDDILKARGSRFSAADIYDAIQGLEELEDYLCLGQNNYRTGDCRFVLFVKIKAGFNFNQELVRKVKDCIKSELTFQHVPEIILKVPEIPYNMNNKRLERLVKTVIATNKIPQIGNVKNPECLKFFLDIPELKNY